MDKSAKKAQSEMEALGRKNELMNTIQLPKNIRKLSQLLPQANYDENKLINKKRELQEQETQVEMTNGENSSKQKKEDNLKLQSLKRPSNPENGQAVGSSQSPAVGRDHKDGKPLESARGPGELSKEPLAQPSHVRHGSALVRPQGILQSSPEYDERSSSLNPVGSQESLPKIKNKKKSVLPQLQ